MHVITANDHHVIGPRQMTLIKDGLKYIQTNDNSERESKGARKWPFLRANPI